MARGGSKRAAAKAPAGEPQAKRIAAFLKQFGVSRASFQPVVEAVEHPLAKLPEDTRSMLLAALPWSIAVPVEQRHEVQHALVGMVDQVVESVHAQLQQAVSTETSTVEGMQSNKSTLAARSEQAEATAVDAAKGVEDCQACLSDAKATHGGKVDMLKQDEAAETETAADLEKVRAQMSEFEEVLSSSFAKLRDGSFEDAEADSLVQKVMAVGQKGGLEESLLATLPTCLAKRERGAFDQVVLDGAEQGLQGRIAALREAVAGLESKLSEAGTSAQVAKEELEAALDAQTKASEQLQSKQEASSQASAEAAEAKRALTNFDQDLSQVQDHLLAKRSELESFCSYNLAMFKMLRDATASKPEPPSEEAVPMAQDQQMQQQLVEEEPSVEQPVVAEAPMHAEQAAEASSKAAMMVEKVQEPACADVVAFIAPMAGA